MEHNTGTKHTTGYKLVGVDETYKCHADNKTPYNNAQIIHHHTLDDIWIQFFIHNTIILLFRSQSSGQ